MSWVGRQFLRASGRQCSHAILERCGVIVPLCLSSSSFLRDDTWSIERRKRTIARAGARLFGPGPRQGAGLLISSAHRFPGRLDTTMCRGAFANQKCSGPPQKAPALAAISLPVLSPSRKKRAAARQSRCWAPSRRRSRRPSSRPTSTWPTSRRASVRTFAR